METVDDGQKGLMADIQHRMLTPSLGGKLEYPIRFGSYADAFFHHFLYHAVAGSISFVML